METRDERLAVIDSEDRAFGREKAEYREWFEAEIQPFLERWSGMSIDQRLDFCFGTRHVKYVEIGEKNYAEVWNTASDSRECLIYISTADDGNGHIDKEELEVMYA
jgi:hypothetical protein